MYVEKKKKKINRLPSYTSALLKIAALHADV